MTAEGTSSRPPSHQPEGSARPVARGESTDALAWLRREFVGLNAQVRALSEAAARQETRVLELAGAVARDRGSRTEQADSQIAELNTLADLVRSQSSELNVSLAELEGCAAELRNEATKLRELREAMTEAVPPMVDAAARHAVAAKGDELRSELSTDVAELVRSLPSAVEDAAAKTLPSVVETAVRQATEAAMAGAQGALAEVATRLSEVSGAVARDTQLDDDLVAQLQKAVHESVLQAVKESMSSGVVVPPAAAPPARPPADDPTSGEVGAGKAETAAGARVPAGPPPPDPTEARLTATAEPAPSPRPAVQEPAATSLPPAEAAPAVADDEAPDPQSGEPQPVAPPPSPAPHPPVTCALAGLAVGPSFALGISDALSQARTRRRRRRPARPPSAGLFRHDPYAGQIGGTLERFALARRDLAFDRGPASDAGDTGPDPTSSARLVAVGEKDGQEVGMPVGDHACGLSLVGPQTDDVARAIAMSFLAGAQPSRAEVMVVGGLLAGPDVPGLTRAGSLGPVLDRLEPEVAQRARALSDDGTADIAAYQTRHPDTPMPWLLVVTPELNQSDHQRVKAILDRSIGLGLAMLFVDAALDGSTTIRLGVGAVAERVEPEGRAESLLGTRFFHVGAEAAEELLGVLATARADAAVALNGEVGDEPFRVQPAPGSPPISVSVLGAYRIEVGGGEIRSGLRAKARELLAFYLIHPEGATLDAATEALWPEADPGRGSEWFWTALGNLRSLLRGATGQPKLKVIERSGDLYQVEPVFEVDLWRFQAALGRAGKVVDAAWTAAVQEAAEVYGGDLVAGADWAWVEVPRDDLRRRAVDVFVSVAATRQVAGEMRGALEALQKAVEVDPLAEQAYRRIMRLHARLARPEEVAATFGQLRSRLEELGLEPTSESQQLCAELCGSG